MCARARAVAAQTPVPKGSLWLPFAPQFRPKGSDGATAAEEEEEEGCAQRSWPVERFFDEDGVFLELAFEQEVADFLAEYEARGTKKSQ